MFTRKFFILIQESRNQKGKEVIYMQTVLEFRKKKILLLYRTVCSVFLFFFFFSFPIFLTAITKDSKRLQGLLLCIKKNNRNSWRRNGAEQNSIFVLAMSHRGILSLSLSEILFVIFKEFGDQSFCNISVSVSR